MVGAQKPLAIRPLGPIVLSTKALLPSVASIRQLRNGGVLVNDPGGHKVVLFDSTLSSYSIVADTTSGTRKAYGNQIGSLIPYVADSTLFLDVASLSFVVISPEGKIIRVMAVPQTQDIISMALPSSGAAFDAQGRLVYRQSFNFKGGGKAMSKSPTDTASPPPDSSPVVRVDLKTRKVDTVARLRVQPTQYASATLANGSVMRRSLQNPLPLNDDWALLADGSIAIVRAQDYHIDWVGPDGAQRSTPKISHQWVRLSDSAKVALLDSAKQADSVNAIKRLAQMASGGGAANGGGGAPVTMSFGSADASGGGNMTVMMSGDGGGGGMATKIMVGGDGSGGGGGAAAAAAALAGAPGSSLGATNPFAQPMYIAASDLPDYWPAFISSGVGRLETRADADGNIWIHVNPPAGVEGGPVFDVVNRAGALVDRVQIPGGCAIVGFAPGFVYLTSREGTGIRLARARIR